MWLVPNGYPDPFPKVFGVAPPQTLYHTRKSDVSVPHSPGSAPVLSVDIDTSPALTPLDPFSFFTVQGFGHKGKKFQRSTTPDSSQALLSESEPSNSIEIYNSYHDSLNSLIEIVDNVSLPLSRILIAQLTKFFSSPGRQSLTPSDSRYPSRRRR